MTTSSTSPRRAADQGGSDTLGDIALPRSCSGCRAPGEWLCVACADSCEPVTLALPGLRVSAAGELAGPLREAVHALKYRGDHALSAELGALVARRVARDLATGALLDAVIPLPLHRRRLRERGYDQAVLLAEEVARACGLPVLRALRRIRWARAQVELDRVARLANARGAFAGAAGSLAGLRVALIDDVVTTGATLRAGAAAARACGARAARGYVVASDL